MFQFIRVIVLNIASIIPRGKQSKSPEYWVVGWVGPERSLTNFRKLP